VTPYLNENLVFRSTRKIYMFVLFFLCNQSLLLVLFFISLDVRGFAFQLAVTGADVEFIVAEKVQLRRLADISATVFRHLAHLQLHSCEKQ
jgi:hypothetical protein